MLSIFLVPANTYAYTDASSRIQIYYQEYKSTNSWSKLKLSGNDTMGTSGCLIFAYAHAIQWFTGEKATGTYLLQSMINEGRSPALYNPDYYAKKPTCIGRGIYSVGGKVTADNITSILGKGQVILANTSFRNKENGHYVLAVDYTTRDVDGNGKADTLIHVVDSARQSAYRRIVAENSDDRKHGYYARGFKMYDYSSFKAMGKPEESCGQYWIKAPDFVSAMNKAMCILGHTSVKQASTLEFRDVK